MTVRVFTAPDTTEHGARVVVLINEHVSTMHLDLGWVGVLQVPLEIIVVASRATRLSPRKHAVTG